MSLSQRLQDFAARQLYVQDWQPALADLDQLQLPVLGTLAFQWRQQELFLWPKNPPDLVERAYLEAFAQMAKNLSWSKLNILGVRELENFLRDHNHSPAHDHDQALTPGLWLESLRQGLLRPWFVTVLSGSALSQLSGASDAGELAHALSTLNSDFWGAKTPASVAQSTPMNLIPLDNSATTGWEIQWRFPADSDGHEAQAFCQALEFVGHRHGVTVKVVAES